MSRVTANSSVNASRRTIGYRGALLALWLLQLACVFAFAVPAQAATETAAPAMAIPIPDVNLTKAFAGGSAENPWLAQYMVGAYKTAASFAMVLAVVMVTIGGFIYLTAGGDTGRVTRAKDMIKDAIAGLLLVFLSFIIATNINQNLTNMTPIVVKSVAPEVFLFANGTSEPATSDAVLAKQEGETLSGASTNPVEHPTPDADNPNAGASGVSSAAASSIPMDQRVDTSKIKWNADEGFWPFLKKNYCTDKKTVKANSETYEQKVQYLVKAVLGFIDVCVTHRGCAYMQGGSGSPAVGRTLPNFAVPALEAHGKGGPADTFSGLPDCLDRWQKAGDYAKLPGGGPYIANQSDACVARVNELYKQYYLAPINEKKMFVGDCGTTVRAILTCSGLDWKNSPMESVGKVKTAYLSAKSIDAFDSDPNMIISAYQKENLDTEAAKKGGLKFGDLIYTCCGGPPGAYSAHWFMYIGGRPEIPYSFIEMGGNPGDRFSAKAGNPVVDGWGSTGGVVLKKPGLTLEQIIRPKFIPQPPTYCKQGTKMCPTTVPVQKGVENSLIYVWRTFN